jgi:putative endopeptidase
MKTFHLAWLSTILILSACASPPRDSASPKALGLGIDKALIDPGVRPQDDPYRFVSGKWLETTEIPADKSNYGSFTELSDKAEIDIRAIIEEAAADDHPQGSELQKVGDFYRAYMNKDLIAQKGLAPIRGDLDEIAALSNRDDLVRHVGRLQRVGSADPIGFYVQPDLGDSSRYMAYVWQTGLGLPNRDYYFDAEFADIRVQYVQYIEDLLSLAEIADASQKAKTIMTLETRFAEAHWDKVRNRKPDETYNLYSLEEVDALTPGFDWQEFLRAAGIDDQKEIVLSQPSFVQEAVRALNDEPLDTWKTYFTYKLIDNSASYLTEDFVELSFDFYGRTLNGTEEIRPRWKRAVANEDNMLGEALGKIYVERHYPPAAKARMDEMIENLQMAFQQSIADLDWMGPETKAQAQEKLQKFTSKIGYPAEWRDYSALEIDPNDLVGNIERATEYESQRNIDKLGGPIDKNEWFMTPQTVNAYYSPPKNEIVFPAAILQAPFFDVTADDAVNYGGIGAVIGHEFSHGFDDSGRKFDGDGNLRDWWTEEDSDRFQARAEKLGAQYDAYNPIDDMHVNGAFTMGENIGDLAGLTMSYRAYRLSLGGREAPMIDGYTGDQRFFMGWAQIWRRLYRDDALRMRLKTDPHSPGEYRANGTLINIDEFHNAFNTQPGDQMWKAPDERVRIW